MTSRSWPAKFEFPEKRDERAMRFILSFCLISGAGMKLFLSEIPVPLIALELSIGFTLGSILFLLFDLIPMSDSGWNFGQTRPPLADMLAVILIWGSLVSACIMMGSIMVLGGISLFTAIFLVCGLAAIQLLIPAMCWNLRMLYRKIQEIIPRRPE